jgi:Right handed beta helix region
MPLYASPRAAGLLQRRKSLTLAATALLTVCAALAGAPVVLAAPAAPACSIFVSPGGGGSGSSVGSPTALAVAVGEVSPGDVVCLEAGTYDASSNIQLSRSGSSSAPITFTGFGGVVLIRYTGGSLGGGVLQTSLCTPWCGSHDLVIENLTIDGADLIDAGIFVRRGAHNITIRNCVIRNTGATGIALNATDYVTVEHNQIFHAGYNQGWSSGISLWYGGDGATYGGSSAWFDTAAGFHNFIVGNVVSGSYDNSSYHSDGNGIIVDGSGSIPPALIANNLVYENGGSGIVVYYNSGDIWVENNTAYANGLDLQVGSGQSPDFIANYATSVHFVNDLAYGRANGSNYTTACLYNSANSSTIGWAHNLGYNGTTLGVSSSIVRDPSRYRYINPLFSRVPAIPPTRTPWASATPPWRIGNDFTPRAGSPTLHAGVDPPPSPA